MLVMTEAQQLATDLRAVLGAPAADEWNRLHLVTVKESLLVRVPEMRARLEHCRDDTAIKATNPDHQAQIQALIDDLDALQAQATAWSKGGQSGHDAA